MDDRLWSIDYMKQIPNIFTLLNLVFGCLAIVAVLQPGLTIGADDNGGNIVMLPEKMFMASVFIGCAAVIDFLDGFVARLLKASSPIGAQLDSLADVVSFGVAPGMIVFQFLRLCYAQQTDGLDTNFAWLLPAFIIPAAGAYRLARFNVDTEQSYGFKGVPIPAAGLVVAAFPLIWMGTNVTMLHLMLNKWFWYAVIIITSYLMISTLPMLALKFKQASFQKFLPFIIIAAVAIISALFIQWIAVPVTFIAYVIISLLFSKK
jgi:CDP-diacylglycerol--serine O-phosphatidyltransferase